MLIDGLDHIQINAPRDHQEEAIEFFVDFLGLEEVEKPEILRKNEGVWFRLPDGREIHTATTEPFVASKKGHACLRTRDLDVLAQRAEDMGILLQWDGRLQRRRIFLHDPWGNRWEVLEVPLPEDQY